MVPESVRNTYNAYLRATRSAQGKPFKYRKDFSKFEDEKMILCTKLSKFFNTYDTINVDEFFEAPFKFLTDFTPSLQFYTTSQARRCYRMLQKKKLLQSPDSEYHLQFAKRSFQFITKYCMENNLKLNEYLSEDKFPPAWALHIKQKEVNIYSLMCFKKLRFHIEGLDTDIGELYLGEIYNHYYEFKKAYMQSKKMKYFVEKAANRCIIKINESIVDSNK